MTDWKFALFGIVLLLSGAALPAQQVEVEEYRLDNGMTFLFVPRKGDPNVAAGWVAKVGSANERPGITGVSHLFEHMMFKGTHTIGTKDIEKDLATIAKLDQVRAQLRAEEQEMLRRLRLGELDDPTNPKHRSQRHQELLDEFNQLLEQQRELLVKNEFDRIYTQAGASGMNAGTTEDFTLYFINVPTNKLELWFWMESDRLLNPVFREFYSERDVVYEERRLRTDSTPTGRFQEEFDAMFWTSHPYGWPVVGWPSDLDGITREEALSFFDIYYAPNNLAACLVGDFEPEEAKKLADKYFGRIPSNPTGAPPVRTREVEQLAEKRMIAFAETNPEVEIRYHSVADGHVDEPALVVLGALLSGRTGRLYKSLVLEQQVANNAFAGQNGQKWAGFFFLRGVAKPGRQPEEVEAAIYKELERLAQEPVGERELQKVKNRFNADTFRRIESNFFLMLQLLLAENGRGWQSFNEDPKKILAVTAEDVQRVAKKYFTQEKRAVALYYTKASDTAAEADPLLAGLDPQQQSQIRQLRAQMAQMSREQLEGMAQQMQAMEAQVPEEQKKFFSIVLQLLNEKLTEKEGGSQ